MTIETLCGALLLLALQLALVVGLVWLANANRHITRGKDALDERLKRKP